MIESIITDNKESNVKVPVCAVIGAPVAHSLSPKIHQDFAKQYNMDLTYKKIHGIAAQAKAQIMHFFDEGGVGLNVTLPFKAIAFNMAKHHTPHSLNSGVANTLWRNANDELCADNTDGLGLLFALNKHLELAGKRVLILGAGGAAQGVIPSLLGASLASLTVANRSRERLNMLSKRFANINYFLFDDLKPSYDIIINATSSGLSNDVPNIPFHIVKNKVCMDMFYDISKDTPFISKCKAYGAALTCDGFPMLVGQAAASFYRWHHKVVSPEITLTRLF